ncbi:hypothetical protein PN498_20610 [Oscillatoria sp. CS-180]|uniref:hypothetical protein n=1 Tax=Oscillatoria sp. CS-180 TaxID=3021720 RepID=UPI002330A3B7|nr:hypothetical protein [Oscillatoria sp. CS-180]MDB9528406.1 hypothetical protein [Oscillatoria sp. CS-180]
MIANTQLIETLVKVIRSLPEEERRLLEEKLLEGDGYPTSLEIMQLAEHGEAFRFLEEEPDIYTSDDGEPVT